MRKLAHLIDDLLDASRVEIGQLHIEHAPVDLATVVVQAVETARQLAKGQPLQLAVEDGAAPLLVTGDATRLQQVVLNLLNNAIIHAPEAAIVVALRRADGMAELAVRDSGPGIDPEAQPHLFTRFYQASPTPAGPAARRGLGLGLYIAREIVMAHGGSIDVASTLGQGTTFTVRLPLPAEEPAPERMEGQN